MCFLPKAAVTKYHWWRDLDNRHLFYLSSGGQKSKIKMSTGVCSLWGLQREDPSLPLLVLSSGWPSFVLLDLQLQHSNLCLCHHVASAHYVYSCVSSFNKDTNHVGLGPTLLQHDRILINCIFNNPISKKVTFQGPRDQDFKVTLVRVTVMKRDHAGPSSEDEGPITWGLTVWVSGKSHLPPVLWKSHRVSQNAEIFHRKEGVMGYALGWRLGVWQDDRGPSWEARARCHHNSASWCIGRVLDTWSSGWRGWDI